MEGINLSGRRGLSSLILAATATLSLAGCIYTFQNPAQQLDGGSIVGQVSLVTPATGQTTRGGTVSVLWSGGLSVTLDSSGTFAFLALPDGTYNINTFVPRPAANDFDSLSLLEGLILPGTPGAVDAVNLSIPVQVSGLVQGTVSSGESGVVVAAFFSLDGGQQTYEGYSATVDGGAYSLLLPAGNHFLYASDSKNSAVESISLPASQTIIQNFDLDGGQSLSNGVLQGNLVFGGPTFGASSPPNEINQILPGVTYQAFDPSGQMVSSGTISTTGQGSAGAPFTITLPAGPPLDVLLFFPTNVATGETFKPLVLRGLPILASGTTYLSQVTWLPVSTFVANGFDAGTGDTYGDGGVFGDGGLPDGGNGGLAWERVAFLDAGAGATIEDIVPLPIPLSGGGFGHRVAWTSSNGLVASDDSSGAFSSPQPIAGNQPATGTLAGTTTLNGGNLFAWVDNGNNLVAEYYSAQGVPNAVSSPLATPIGAGHQALSVFSGSQNAAPGVFALLTGLPGVVPILFSSDYLSFAQLTYPTVQEDAGTGNPGLPITLNSVAAASCDLVEFSGLPGFCFIANANYYVNDGGTIQHLVFVGEVFTSGSQPQLGTLQGLEFVPQTSTVALATLPPDDAGISSVVVAYDNGGTPKWSQFQTLSASPTVATAVSPSAIQLLLPYDAPVALSQGISGGVNTIFLPTNSGPTVDPLNGVQALPLLHGYSDPVTGSPVIAVSSQFDQPPQIIVYELPVDAGVAPDSGALPDGGNPTDGGLPDASLLSDSGWTAFGTAIDSVDGGLITEMLPLPLSSGGHRVVWLQAPSIDVQADSAYWTDDSTGSFSTPMALATNSSPLVDLVGATDSAGNGLAAWLNGSYSGTVSVASFPAAGLPTVFTNVDPNTTTAETLSVLPLTIGPSTGFAVVEALGASNNGAHLVFLSDAGVQIFDVTLPEIDGGCSFTSMAATVCDLSELAGGPGFCVAGGCVNSSDVSVFAAAISTSGALPTVAGHATLFYNSDAGAAIGLPAIVEGHLGQVTVAWVDESTGVPGLFFAQFDNLSQQTYPVSSVTSTAQIQNQTTLMPWRGNPLVLFTDSLGEVSSVALPDGTLPVPPIAAYTSAGSTTSYNQPRAYVDPSDGRLIMTAQPYVLSSQTIQLFELTP
jgi:hypothetical protein